MLTKFLGVWLLAALAFLVIISIVLGVIYVFANFPAYLGLLALCTALGLFVAVIAKLSSEI